MRFFVAMFLLLSGAAVLAVDPIADVAFRYEKNTVLVDHVRINGHGDYTFLIDTGSTACTVTSEVADELRLPRDGWSDVSAIGATRKLRVARVQSISIGNARVPAPLTLIADDNGLSKHVGTPVHGVLGTPFLWRWPIQVDYPARRFRILPREYDLRTEPVESPWSSVGQLILRHRDAYVKDAVYLKVAMNGAPPHDMMLDTGATGIILSEEHAKEAKAKLAHFQSSSVGAFGPRRDSLYWLLDSVRLAGITVEKTQAFTPQQMGNWKSDQLGNDALDQFRLTVDVGHRVFRLERDQLQEYFEDSPWGVGVSVRRDVDGIRVAATWPGGEAATQGITAGDALLKVNEQDVAQVDIDGLKDLLNQPTNCAVSLSVKTGDGLPRTVQLKSQRYTRKRPTDSIATSVSVVQPK